MKSFTKLLLATAVAIALSAGVGASSAQAQLTSGNAIMTLTLTDVMALAVTTPAVPLGFAAITDYQNGVNTDLALQLTVSSNRPYDVKVKAGGDLTAAGGGTIPINKITVQPIPSQTGLGTMSAVNLTTDDQVIIDNAPGAMAKVIGVRYSTNDTSAFIKSGIYTATVTYSISAN